MRRHATLGWLGAAVLIGAMAPGVSYNSAVPLSPIPPHGSPWVETTRLDDHTVFLWKFGDDAELMADLVLPDKDAPVVRDAVEPTLHGDARMTPNNGRFGGGLTVNGAGYVAGAASLGTLLQMENGFTIDGWVQAATPKARETLMVIPDKAGKPILRLEMTPDAEAVVSVDGTERLRVPVQATAGNWHHCMLVVYGGGAQPSLLLRVDGNTQSAQAPEWLRTLVRRMGSALTIGGGPGLPGVHGVLDELRLSTGSRLLYPWEMGRCELRDGRQEVGVKVPFFNTGPVLSRLHFDGTLAAEPFAGVGIAGKEQAKLFQPGVKGQALDLRQASAAGVKLKGFTVIPEKNGTIEFWFRPLDWHNFYVSDFHGTDLKHLGLMQLTADGVPGYLAPKSINVVLGRTWAVASTPMAWTQIHPGAWTHVLIVITNGQPATYLNGQPTKFAQVGLSSNNHASSLDAVKKWRERTGGVDDGAWGLTFPTSATLLDELSVYGWSMTAEEAWNAYARWLPDANARMKALPIFRVDFTYFAHSWDKQEKLVTKLTCLPVEGVKPASADIEIRSDKGEVLFTAEKQALDEAGILTVTLKRPLPFGRYPVTLRSRSAAGAVLKEEKREYLREKPAWYNNTLGTERTVPKPWTPVTVNNRRLQVIDRVIDLGAGGLPEKIETRTQPLLTSPVSMRAVSAAGTGVLEGKGVTFTEQAPDRAAWTAALAGAGLTAAIDASLEFDGLLYCTVTLKPAAGGEVRLDELDIDVPMRATLATQLLANGGGGDFRASWIATMLPEGQGSVWRSVDTPYPHFSRATGVTNFMPHIWLGHDEVGLYFGAENDQGWTVDGPKPAQEILRQDNTVIFRMHVIRDPVTITAQGHRFHFILLPTPAKPEPPDWRKQMATGGVNFGACDSFGGFDMKTDPSDPGPTDNFLFEPRSWEHATTMSAQGRDKWGRSILYADASWGRPGPNFSDWNHDLWAGTGRFAWTPECEDYAVWAINEFLRRGLIDGVYWDDVSVGSTLSLASTAYPYAKNDNGRRVGFTALAQRRVNLRLWRLFEAAGKEPCIWAHMTVCYEVPLFSFCRYLTNGEFVTGVDFPKSRDAMDFWSPERLRILGSSTKWGTGMSFLTTLPRALAPSAAAEQWWYPQRRTEDAIYMAAGIGTISDALTRKLNQERFFEESLTVYQYWKAQEVCRIEAPAGAQILPCVYAAADRAFVLVANRDREARDIAVRLNIATLFPNAKGVTWRDIDPGLTPPKKVMATDQEAKDLNPDVEEQGLEELFDNSPTAAELRKALELRVEDDIAKVRIRPRDYRILEVRPVR